MYKQSSYVLALFLGSSQAYLAGSQSAGLDVNSDVAAVIETTTKASYPTPRSDVPYAPNGSAENAFKRPDLFNATASAEATAKAEPPATGAEVAKALASLNLVQTAEVPAELGGAPSDKKQALGTAPEQVHVLDPIPYQTQSNNVTNELNQGVWRTAFYAQQPVRFFQKANGDIAAVEPWLHEVWSEETEPLSVWKRSTDEAGRDASLKYKYEPAIDATVNATKGAEPVPAAKTEAAAATPPAALVQADSMKKAKLAKAYEQFFQKEPLRDLFNMSNEQLKQKFEQFYQKSGGKSDIAETHVDSWVYDKVAPNVEWAPLGRPNAGPKVDKYWDTPSSDANPTGLPAELAGSAKPAGPAGIAELTGSLSQIRGNFDADVDHNQENLRDPDNVDMYDNQTVYSQPGQAGKLFNLVQRRTQQDTVTPYDKATETIYPPKDPQHPNYYNGQGGLQSLSQEVPTGPELNTYDVWNRKDDAPARESYTPPEGTKPAPWSKAYSNLVQEDGGKHITKAELEGLILNDQDRTNKAYDYNGVSNPASPNFQALMQKRGGWVTDKNIDEKVPQFVNDQMEMFDPTKPNWDRVEQPYNENGLKNPASGYGYTEPAALVQRQHHLKGQGKGADISEKLIDPEVWGLADPNTETINWSRVEEPYNANGLKNPGSGYGYVAPEEPAAFFATQYHNHHNKRDISEKQIDEEVQGMANPLTEYPNWNRSKDPFVMNGSKNPESGYGYVAPEEPAAFLQHKHHNHHHNAKRDISEKQIDEDVQDFANANVERLPWPRIADPFVMNGSKNPESGYGYVAPAGFLGTQHHKHHAHHKKDMSEKQVDEEVWGLANPNTETLNWGRSKDPFFMNGSKNPASGYGYVAPVE